MFQVLKIGKNTALALVIVLASSCSPDQDERSSQNSKKTDAPLVEIQTISPDDSISTKAPTSPNPSDSTEFKVPSSKTGYLLSRNEPELLTPEEISAQIKSLFNIQFGYVDSNGNFRDSIVEGYGRHFGGVDYINTHKRNHLVRVQTLLSTREIAESLVKELCCNSSEVKNDAFDLWEEHEVNTFEARPVIPKFDAGLTGAAKQARDLQAAKWEVQMNYLYGKLFGRLPTENELVIHRIHHSEVMIAQQQFNPAAWAATLYVLFVSPEFWTK